MINQQQIRKNVLDTCIGIIEELYYPQDTYEQLTKLLNTEFPNEGFTLEEVIGFYGISREKNELQIMFTNTYYG